jgi:hypothetical protein
MKNISIFLMILISACHTPAPKTATNTNSGSSETTTKTAAIKEVVFHTGSRGYQKKISLTKDSVLLVINSSFEARPSKNIKTGISTSEWNKVTASLNGVDITGLKELPSPTMKRAVDAADHSSIAVTTDQEYIHSFDNTDPHEQLKKLMEVILEIEASRNK